MPGRAALALCPQRFTPPGSDTGDCVALSRPLLGRNLNACNGTSLRYAAQLVFGISEAHPLTFAAAASVLVILAAPAT